VARARLPVGGLTDEALLAGFGAGDEESTLAFVRRFQAKVFGVAVAILGDGHAAEDVAQLTFERAWRHARTYDSRRGSVVSWLGSIARNAAIDASRVRVATPTDAIGLLERAGVGTDAPERVVLSSESADELRVALALLPHEQARAIVLAGIGGMSASQVASVEGIPLGTAKTRIRTAMMRLREALVGLGVDRG
jgi:RNA polymerase sigma factor (sigma-70 family)